MVWLREPADLTAVRVAPLGPVEHLLAFSRLASIQQHPPPFYTSIHRSIRFRHPRRFEKPPTTDPNHAAPHRRRQRGRAAHGRHRTVRCAPKHGELQRDSEASSSGLQLPLISQGQTLIAIQFIQYARVETGVFLILILVSRSSVCKM